MNIGDQINRYGYRKTAFDIILKIAYRAIKGQIFNVYALPPDDFNTSALNLGALPYSFGFLELEQLLPLIRPEEMTMDHKFAEKGYAKGDRCFGVIDGDNLAHYSWYSATPTIVLDDLKFHFSKDKVYMFNAYTSHKYRGKKLYPLAVTQAVKNYINHGFVGALTIIAANNFSSISAVEQIGFSAIGRFYVSSVGGSYVYPSSGCTNNGVRLVKSL